MTRLTSVYGAFRARVMAARLETEGFDVELRGNVDSPYALNVGEMARVDVYVPTDQVEDASLVLLVDEVDEVDALDDVVVLGPSGDETHGLVAGPAEPPTAGGADRRTVMRWIAAGVLLVLVVAPIARAFHW
jgi:hypothetical protein